MNSPNLQREFKQKVKALGEKSKNNQKKVKEG